MRAKQAYRYSLFGPPVTCLRAVIVHWRGATNFMDMPSHAQCSMIILHMYIGEIHGWMKVKIQPFCEPSCSAVGPLRVRSLAKTMFKWVFQLKADYWDHLGTLKVSFGVPFPSFESLFDKISDRVTKVWKKIIKPLKVFEKQGQKF